MVQPSSEPSYSTSDFIALLYGQLSKDEVSTCPSRLVEEFGGMARTAAFDVADFVAGAGPSEERAWGASLVLGPGEPQLNEVWVRTKELGEVVTVEATLVCGQGTPVNEVDPAQPTCGKLRWQGADFA